MSQNYVAKTQTETQKREFKTTRPHESQSEEQAEYQKIEEKSTKVVKKQSADQEEAPQIKTVPRQLPSKTQKENQKKNSRQDSQERDNNRNNRKANNQNKPRRDDLEKRDNHKKNTQRQYKRGNQNNKTKTQVDYTRNRRDEQDPKNNAKNEPARQHHRNNNGPRQPKEEKRKQRNYNRQYNRIEQKQYKTQAELRKLNPIDPVKGNNHQNQNYTIQVLTKETKYQNKLVFDPNSKIDYFAQAEKLLKSYDFIVIQGVDKNITTVFILAEQICKKIKNIRRVNIPSTSEIEQKWIPKTKELTQLIKYRPVSKISIELSLKDLNKAHMGYQSYVIETNENYKRKTRANRQYVEKKQ